MSAVIQHRTASPRQWAPQVKPRDPNVRRQMFGPVQPMEPPGFFARLFHLRG
ncbi:MAG: hypothetical protein RLZZ08_315 [Pseudomonadota bacterium]|jgi:hypothetical protein